MNTAVYRGSNPSEALNGILAPSPTRDLLTGGLFALAIVFLPWETIRGTPFADIANYAARMLQLQDYGPDYFAWEDSIGGWLSFEYFWFRLMVLAVHLKISPELFIQIIAVVSSVLTYRFMAARVGPFVPFLVLLNPISIDLLSSQSRSAFAFALFLTIVDALPARRHIVWRYACLAALPFIHTASIAIIGIYAGATALSSTRAASPLIKAALVAAAAGTFVVAVVIFLPEVVEASGDRRDLDAYATKTLFYLTFWFVTAGALLISYDRETCSRWEYLFALFVCLSAPLIEALGKPGFRFVALGIPLIWIAIGRIREPLRTGMMAAAALYWALLVYYWVR